MKKKSKKKSFFSFLLSRPMRAGVAGLVRRVCVWGRREGDSGEAGHSHCVATEKDQSVKRSEKKRKKIEKIIFFSRFFPFRFFGAGARLT